MTEHEKELQIGKLALEYSEVKGHLNQLNEKLNRAKLQGGQLAQANLDQITIQNGIAQGTIPSLRGQRIDFDALLGPHELAEVIESLRRKQAELTELTGRLKVVAPHLL